MAHKFNIKHMQKLDSPQRRNLMPPLETLKSLGLKSTDTVADIGCGIGYFTNPAAEIVKDNKVYALDPSSEMLEWITTHSEAKNIVPVKTTDYDFIIEDDMIDFALLANVFHEIDDKGKFIKEIKRILKLNGRLAVIEWQKKEAKMGPDLAHRISPPELNSLLSDYFKQKYITDISGEFYGAVYSLV